ncbi:MAG: glycosyltransferase family 2 protein [Phocaeicola sp.]
MSWYKKYRTVYEKPFSQASPTVIAEVKEKLAALQSSEPLVTLSVIGYNEERHLLACLWSLSEMRCHFPIEIIGVDNDSTDATAAIFKAVGLPYYTEYQHSCGHARSCGLHQAKGKYHLNIDADTLYPPHYVEKMVKVLSQKGVVAVSSLWSYMPDKEHSWLGLKLYEFTRDCYLFALSFKRPELSVRGLVFGYHTELAKKIGIRTHIIRGEDGALASELKIYGKIAFIRDLKARAVTGYGTVAQDGSFFKSFKNRVVKVFKERKNLVTSQEVYIDEESNLVKPKEEQ